MKSVLEKLARHLKGVGLEAPLVSLKAPTTLPVHVRERYHLYQARLFGRDWVLALERGDWEVGAPSEYRHHVDLLSSVVQRPVALVLRQISSASRSRLIQMSVPFVVPGTQIFLPLAMINLQEIFKTQQPEKGRPLSPIAQVLVLHEILDGRFSGMASKWVAQETGYSEMGISKARSELEANELCALTRKGKVLQTEFQLSPQDLWEKALPLLRSPARKRRWLQWTAPPQKWKLAGISALAAIGQIADDAVPSYATDSKGFRKYLEHGAVHGSDRHEASAQVEIWPYEPSLLSHGAEVDFLSLYLSLRMNPDERVQADLAEQMEAFKWR